MGPFTTQEMVDYFQAFRDDLGLRLSSTLSADILLSLLIQPFLPDPTITECKPRRGSVTKGCRHTEHHRDDVL